MEKFVGGVFIGFSILLILAFPIFEGLGIWATGDIVHKYVGTGFLSLGIGGAFFALGSLILE